MLGEEVENDRGQNASDKKLSSHEYREQRARDIEKFSEEIFYSGIIVRRLGNKVETNNVPFSWGHS
jgi:hypothetical protein